MSCLEGEVFTCWCQLAHQGKDHELGTLEWSKFKLELVDVLMDIDHKLNLYQRLVSLQQSNIVAIYVEKIRYTMLELGD